MVPVLSVFPVSVFAVFPVCVYSVFTVSLSGVFAVATAVTLDHNWRWLHAVGDYVNCYEGNEWDDKFCPDVATCTENCALGGDDGDDWYYDNHNDDDDFVPKMLDLF